MDILSYSIKIKEIHDVGPNKFSKWIPNVDVSCYVLSQFHG